MAFSPLRSKAFNHSRSLSLPSKSNPAISQFEQNLCNVRCNSEASCSSLSSMNNKVNALKNLYSNIDDLLQLPHIQQECQEIKWVDQLLDGHIRLLDACTTAKDLLSQTKQHVQDLLSALRRKDMDGVPCCLNSRKKSKKAIQKSLKDLRSFKSQNIITSSDKDNETMDLVFMLKEAELVTIRMLESLLLYLNGTSKVQNGWSLVSKLIHSKKAMSYQNEFEKMDAFLQMMSLEDVQIEMLMTHLKGMDSNIHNLEQEIDCLFRQLIKTRVVLLNFLNH
ncbi:hypothetical protein DH2020_044748 [Rehmannia glutinosa]|uniref:Uncharacterized protein n=1 Tax=Rehmannia glutinosa TaxID=99300 RepID=A0ABR0UGU6_REHGL